MFHANQLNDYEIELMRETAAQLAGYEPSPVWGKLLKYRERAETPIYEKIMNINDQEELHSFLLDHDEKNHNAFRNVINIASDVSRGSNVNGSNIIYRHPDLSKYPSYLKKINGKSINLGAYLPLKEVNKMESKSDVIHHIKEKLPSQTPLDHPILYHPEDMKSKKGRYVGYFDKYGYGYHY